jgi:hypothetical protein
MEHLRTANLDESQPSDRDPMAQICRLPQYHKLLQYYEQYFYYSPINLDEHRPYDLKYTVKIIYYIGLPAEDPDPRTAVF